MFKNIRNFLKYRKFVDENRTFFLTEFNLRSDKIYRLYTTVGLDLSKQEFIKNSGSIADNEAMLDAEVGKFVSLLQRYFMQSGMLEFIGDIKFIRFDEVNVDIIIKFKFLNIEKIINRVRFGHILFLVIAIGLIFINPLFSIIPIFGNLLLLFYNKILFKRFFI